MRQFGSKGSWRKVLKHVAVVLAFCLTLILLSLCVNFWAYREIQSRLKIHVKGTYVPDVFIPSFEVKKATFVWEDKVELLDGDFKVTFDPLTLVAGKGIRIILTSRSSRIRFLGNWAVQEGIENASVDSMVADVVLGRRGLAGINEVEVKSSSFQFSLKNVDKKKQK